MSTYGELLFRDCPWCKVKLAAVVQPYLHGIRGLEAPTFMLRNKGDSTGLFPVFERNFDWLWDRSTVI